MPSKQMTLCFIITCFSLFHLKLPLPSTAYAETVSTATSMTANVSSRFISGRLFLLLLLGFAVCNLLDDLAWLLEENRQCVLPFVGGIGESNGEVAAVLKHLKLPRMTPLLAIVDTSDRLAAVKTHRKAFNGISATGPEGNAADGKANLSQVAPDRDVEPRHST